MKLYYNHQQTLVLTFKPSNKIYINSSDIQTTHLLAKLSHQYLKPYIVKKQVEPSAYHLKIASSIQHCQAHYHI